MRNKVDAKQSRNIAISLSHTARLSTLSNSLRDKLHTRLAV
jgi:hypothetical protein